MHKRAADYLYSAPQTSLRTKVLLVSARIARGTGHAVVAALLMLSAACVDAQGTADSQPSLRHAVTAIAITPTTVTQHAQYPAQLRGAREVAVRARVPGILLARHYLEGAQVEQGETLFQIDPEPYEIALEDAQAELADAKASEIQAKRDWQRHQDLYDQNAVSAQALDKAEASWKTALARIDRMQAAVKDAVRKLQYTKVHAPITGTVGMEAVSEGNLVREGELLTRMLQLDPVHAHFSLPFADAASLQKMVRRLPANDDRNRIPVRVLLGGGTEYEHDGYLDYSDDRINPRTGNVAMRASIPNPQGVLLPGQFVRVHLPITTFDEVFQIDPASVSEGPDGPRVFIVDSEDKAQVRSVVLGPIIDGKQIVLKGLMPGDRLVVQGHLGLQAGTRVAVTEDAADTEG